jgi:hypothetical protein
MLVSIIERLSPCSSHIKATDPRRGQSSERKFPFREPMNDRNVFSRVFSHLIAGINFIGSNRHACRSR